jgi:hypothetical protein
MPGINALHRGEEEAGSENAEMAGYGKHPSPLNN